MTGLTDEDRRWITEKLNGLATRMDHGFQRLDSRMALVENAIVANTQRVSANQLTGMSHEEWAMNTNQDIARIEARIRAIEADVAALKNPGA
jgi:hypothetical protein